MAPEKTRIIKESIETAVGWHAAGRLAEAAEIYRQVLLVQPDNSDAVHLLGLVAHQQGKHADAVELIRKAIALRPDQAHFHNNLGEALRSLGRIDEAEACYEKAIEISPSFPEAHNNLGIVLMERGEGERAAKSCRQALLLRPDYIEALCNLGNALKETGHLDEALGIYERVLTLRPGFIDAYRNMGRIFREMGKAADEVSCYRRALSIDAKSAEIHCDLGAALHEAGFIGEAIEHYRLALAQRPHFPEVLNNLGTALRMKGCFGDAVSCFEQALAQRPEYGEALNNIGIACYEDNRFSDAVTCFKRAVRADPRLASGYSNLAMVLAETGDVESALDLYEKAMSLQPQDGLRIRAATIAPVIMQSGAHIVTWRAGLEDRIEQLRRSRVSIGDPIKEVGKMHFYLPYQGRNDRDLQVKLARLYREACPGLTFTAPHCVRNRRGQGANGKLKLGFVSRHLRDHTVGRYVASVIAFLNRDRFSVHTLTFPQRPDNMSRFIEAGSDSHTVLTPALAAARREISELELDILFFPDIGMESLTYFLAFGRLAPVQCAFYGHPVTTGIDTVDYFISHEDCEVPGSDRYYSEHLLKLPSNVTYTCFQRPEAGPFTKGRDAFGLSESAHIYYCPQSLFKIHPDFDPMVDEILKTDPEGMLLLVEGKHSNWTTLLRKRFAATIKDSAAKVLFMPMLPHQDFLNLISLSDVVLDTPHFNGGGTTFDALSAGTPVVTIPGEFLRGRQTYSLYKRMGVMDCVAETEEDYVATALRLASDRGYREAVRGKILSRNHLIFDDRGTVREVENLLLRMWKEKTS